MMIARGRGTNGPGSSLTSVLSPDQMSRHPTPRFAPRGLGRLLPLGRDGSLVKEGCPISACRGVAQDALEHKSNNDTIMAIWSNKIKRGKPGTLVIHVQNDKIVIEPDAEALEVLREMAQQRGKTVPEVIAEALRLERLLTDQQLLIKEDGAARELLEV
jgi:hypothetical protein